MHSLNSNYEKFILIGDFISEDHEIEISSFLNNYEANKIVKEKTCFNSILNPLNINLFIANSPKRFQHTHSFPCGFSDHLNIVVTVLQNTFEKQWSNIIYYKDWEKPDNAVFQTEQRNT